jgi:hypothetical protein
MKTGKEVKVATFKNYNVVYGSVNNKHSKAVYINISAWAEPTDEDIISYSRVIRDINKNIRQNLFNLFNGCDDCEFIKDRTIVDLDIRESGIKYGKRSFTNCEITLFLNNEIPVNSDIMRPMLDNVVNMLVNNVFDNNKTFKFHRKKK